MSMDEMGPGGSPAMPEKGVTPGWNWVPEHLNSVMSTVIKLWGDQLYILCTFWLAFFWGWSDVINVWNLAQGSGQHIAHTLQMWVIVIHGISIELNKRMYCRNWTQLKDGAGQSPPCHTDRNYPGHLTETWRLTKCVWEINIITDTGAGRFQSHSVTRGVLRGRPHLTKAEVTATWSLPVTHL